jgi:hypothetical protein
MGAVGGCFRRNKEAVATGRLTHDPTLKVGDKLVSVRSLGIARSIDPIIGEHELGLVIQMPSSFG